MRSRLVKAIFLGFLTGIVGVVISPFHFALNIEENAGLGLLFKRRGARQAPSDVVVVSIDRESSENLDLPDNPDKWPRSFHARLTENLAREGAEVIAFDVHFIEPRSTEDDNLFAEAIREARNVVLAEPLKAKEVPSSDTGGSQTGVHSIVKIVKPIDLFSRPAVATAPFPLPRIPFKVNQYWIFQTGAGDSPTLPVVAFQLFALQIYEDFIQLLEKVSPNHAVKLPGDRTSAIETIGVKRLMRDIREIFESEPAIAERMLEELEHSEPLSADMKKYRLLKSLIKMYGGANSRYINYYGPPRTIITIPYHQALELRDGAAGDKQIDLKGKAVFVGLSEILLADRKDSFYTVFSQANGIFISGVEIAATAFSNLMEDMPVKPIGLRYFMLIILLWGILTGIFCRLSHIVVAALGAVGLSVLYLLAAEYQFKTNDTWYPIVIPLFIQTPLAFFGAVVWNYIDTNKERQKIRKAFEYHLPKHVVDQLAKDIAHIETGSQVVYGICLTTDAEHYTTLSETMDPMELANFMNRYYEAIFKPTRQHGGAVSDIIGDSMMALWVASRPENSLMDKACFAALDIQKAMKQFNESSGAVQLNTRVGINSGQILLGHIGAIDHYEYRPVGDIVNTASRIEGLNKHLGTRVLVSEEVIHQLDSVLTREVGQFRLKGKAKPITIYELMCRIEESDEKQRGFCEIFAEAMGAFRRQSWDEATEKFHQCIENLGEDGPSRFYIRLCEQYRQTPPEEPWDGVVHMEKK
ncbi:MAG: CHASE2 domain-containing protein [Proteobacteria bacterium]|nr:CHASE2 domain-containing protein [Pseudomonadota bacterium]NIS71447.1 CHASE2 domain-containing protein [Pseudomonadota bacterium]